MTVAETYTIQVVHGDEPIPATELLDAIMLEAEENITDLLPFGFTAHIRRWNQPDSTQEEQR